MLRAQLGLRVQRATSREENLRRASGYVGWTPGWGDWTGLMVGVGTSAHCGLSGLWWELAGELRAAPGLVTEVFRELWVSWFPVEERNWCGRSRGREPTKLGPCERGERWPGRVGRAREHRWGRPWPRIAWPGHAANRARQANWSVLGRTGSLGPPRDSAFVVCIEKEGAEEEPRPLWSWGMIKRRKQPSPRATGGHTTPQWWFKMMMVLGRPVSDWWRMEHRLGRGMCRLSPCQLFFGGADLPSPRLRTTSRSWRSCRQRRKSTATVPRRNALNSSHLRWRSWSTPTSQVSAPFAAQPGPGPEGKRGEAGSGPEWVLVLPFSPHPPLPAVQFEGSLGKLTVSSVNNPRKMIDAVVTSRGEDDVSSGPARSVAGARSRPQPWLAVPPRQETKEKQVRDKRRQTLVTIEKVSSRGTATCHGDPEGDLIVRRPRRGTDEPLWTSSWGQASPWRWLCSQERGDLGAEGLEPGTWWAWVGFAGSVTDSVTPRLCSGWTLVDDQVPAPLSCWFQGGFDGVRAGLRGSWSSRGRARPGSLGAGLADPIGDPCAPPWSPSLLQTYSLLLDVEDYERRYLLSLEGERPALMGERKQKICDMYDNLRGKAPGQERWAEATPTTWSPSGAQRLRGRLQPLKLLSRDLFPKEESGSSFQGCVGNWRLK